MTDLSVTTPRTVTVAMALERHPAVGRNRIYLALGSGALPSARAGKRIAIAVEDLDEWVLANCPKDIDNTQPHEQRRAAEPDDPDNPDAGLRASRTI